MQRKFLTKENQDDERLEAAIEKMAKTVDGFKESIRCIRDGCVSTALIDSVKTPACGQPTLIKHLATTISHHGQIHVKPFDTSLVQSIGKTLEKEGFNAYVFSRDTVCVQIPPRSGEDREKTRQHIRKLGEDAKVAIRNIRKACRNSMGAHTKDEKQQLELLIQEKTDQAVGAIDAIVASKVASI